MDAYFYAVVLLGLAAVLGMLGGTLDRWIIKREPRCAYCQDKKLGRNVTCIHCWVARRGRAA